jgi:RimJ/RimL family protein N-acetyltransferase
VGQVRIEIEHNHEAVIGISIDIQLRGNGHGVQMLELAVVTFRKEHPKTRINAYIKIENKSSQVIFEKAHFNLEAEILYKNVKSYHYVRNEDC